MWLADAAAQSRDVWSVLKEFIAPVGAACGAIFGGAGLKWIDNRSAARSKKTDIEIKLHDEARDVIRDMQTRLDRLSDDLRSKDQLYNRALIKYNVLRERYHLPFDLDDPELQDHVQKMMGTDRPNPDDKKETKS